MPEAQETSGPPTSPRRRKRGVQPNGRFQGTRPTIMKPETLSAKLKFSLSLDFDPEEWQLTVIQRILQRYDVIFIAGTSYGKSLIFEGVAAIPGEKRVCAVVTPPKALERDQVQEATKKGLTAVMINEDNSSNARLWQDVSNGAYQLVYMLVTARYEFAGCKCYFGGWRLRRGSGPVVSAVPPGGAKLHMTNLVLTTSVTLSVTCWTLISG